MRFRAATAALAGALIALGTVAPLQATAGPAPGQTPRALGARHRRHHVRPRPAHVATTVIQRRVRRPGVYTVRVAVTTPLARGSVVRLRIGRQRRRATTAGRRRQASVRAKVIVRGKFLRIWARTSRGRLRVRVQLRRVRLSISRKVPGSEHAKRPGSPRSATTGVSGASGSSGVSNVAPVVPAASQASAVGAVPAAPAGLPGSWHLAFDDEFNGSSLDTSRWSTGWFGSGITGGISASEPECYDPSHVVQSNGELDLNLTATPESCDGSTHPYASGMVTTNGKFSFTYGYIEVRAWLPATSSGQIADWPGIWTDGQNWPSTGELDILEGLGGQACAHWHGPTANGAGYGANGGTGCPPGTFTGGWHTFAADWEPGIVTWYYDGQNIGCIETSGSTCGNYNTTITSNPMYLILALGSDAANTITAPASQRTDYVRVYQH